MPKTDPTHAGDTRRAWTNCRVSHQCAGSARLDLLVGTTPENLEAVILSLTDIRISGGIPKVSILMIQPAASLVSSC
jgi:hypothetical protein